MMLQTSTRMLGDVAVVDCSGRIVYGDEAVFLHQQVKELLGRHPHVVLNLADVSFVDSNGVGTMVGLWATAQGVGGDLKLAGLSPRLLEVFRITRLTSIFGIFDTAEEAAATLAR